MIFASIDPGQTGAVAVFDGKALLEVFDFNFENVDDKQILVATNLIMDINRVTGGKQISAVVVEKVNFIRGQGGVSSFSFGSRFGEATTLARMLSDNVILFPPATWKRSVGLIGTDKEDSAKKASKVYPGMADRFSVPSKRAKNGMKWFDGRGDAVMMGLAAIKTGLVE